MTTAAQTPEAPSSAPKGTSQSSSITPSNNGTVSSLPLGVVSAPDHTPTYLQVTVDSNNALVWRYSDGQDNWRSFGDPGIERTGSHSHPTTQANVQVCQSALDRYQTVYVSIGVSNSNPVAFTNAKQRQVWTLDGGEGSWKGYDMCASNTRQLLTRDITVGYGPILVSYKDPVFYVKKTTT